MNLVPGSRVGSYEIISIIGAGGMGEVYRARDSRLSRDVAVKVLPESLAQDQERLGRFVTEARAAGAISHPNILSVFDIGNEDGAPFLVTELLEGQNLREVMDAGPIPRRRAIEYALQIAGGLAAAHQKGIIHRDIKPENIFVTKDHRIKLLDFGLARASNLFPGGPDAETVPLGPLTSTGMVLGTVGYMAPEQVRGLNVDHRADIFSFGAVFYEMLTGKRAFHRDTPMETLTAILRDQPVEASAINADIAPGIEVILDRCLEKDPDQRFQSAGDLAFALQSLSSSGSRSAFTFFTRRSTLVISRRTVVLAAAGLAIAAAGSLYAWFARNGATPVSTQFQRLTFNRGYIISARFTPDGSNLVYSAAWHGQPFELFMTRPGGLESRPLGLKNATLLGISRKGDMAVLTNQRLVTHWIQMGTLARVSLEGGAVRELLENVSDGDISADGRNFAVVHTVNGRQRLEYPIGRVLYETDGYISHTRLSPDGGSIAFLDHPVYGDDRGYVAVIKPGEAIRRITNEWGSAEGLAWLPNGKEIWFAAVGKDLHKLIYAVTLDGKLREVWRGPVDAMVHDIAADGRLLLTREDVSGQMIGWQRGQAQESNLTWLGWTLATAISPDGSRIGFTEYNVDPGTDYYACLRPLDGAPPVRLGEGQMLAFSPDASRIASMTPSRPGHLNLLPTGAGETQTLSLGHIRALPRRAAWSPDGASIYFTGVEPDRRLRTYRLGISGGDAEPVTREGEWGSLLSPDGSTLVVQNAAGGYKLVDVRSGGESPIQGLHSNEHPIGWTGEGDALWIRAGATFPYSIQRLAPASGARAPHLDLKPIDPAGALSVPGIAISGDGAAYAYNVVRILSDLYLANGLR